MSSDVNSGGEGGESALEPGHCTVFLHAEKFTSSTSSQIFLLQIGAVVVEDVTRDAKKFFCAVRPSSRIVDNYSFNGDLETIFNMTKESESTWLFRRRFDVAARRKVCRSEKSAIVEFIEFVLKLKKKVLFVSVDEETLSVVLHKCKQISKEKHEELLARISGFTYWSRTLRKVSSSPTLDLEEYNKDISGFCSAIEVAKILRKAYTEVTKGSKPNLIIIKDLKRPHRHTVKKDGPITIEISSTFRNSPSCIITGEKREQVVIEDSSDESDVEILPDEKNHPGEHNKVKFESRLSCSSQPRPEKRERETNKEYFEEKDEEKKTKNKNKLPTFKSEYKGAEDRFKCSNAEYIEEKEEDKKDAKCEQKLKNNNVINLDSEDEGPEVKIVREQEILPCKFVNFKVHKDTEADLHKCHFCGIHCSPSSLELHYKVSHKAFDWCQLTFPGTPVFKEFSGNFECCICKFAFKNIANHLRRDHNVANVKDFLGLIQQRYSPTLDLSESGVPPPSSNADVQTRHLLPIYSSDLRPRSVNNNVEKEKRKIRAVGKKGRKEIKCIFCESSCVQKNISKHYKRHHKGEAWANLPGTKVYKYVAEFEKYECQICRIGLNCVKDLLFTGTGIVKHLRKYHKISGQRIDGQHLNPQPVVRQVKQLPQAGDSQKRKETESNDNVNPSAIGAKKVRNQKNHLEKPQAIATLQTQQPTHLIRPPPPYLPFQPMPTHPHPRLHNWPPQPFPRFHHLPPQNYPRFHPFPPPNGTRPDHHSFRASYPDPGDDGWRMWR